MNLLALNLNIFIFLEYVDGRIGCRGRMFYSLVDRAWICVILPSGIREPAKTGQWTRLMEYSESCPKVEIENFPKSENVRLENWQPQGSHFYLILLFLHHLWQNKFLLLFPFLIICEPQCSHNNHSGSLLSHYNHISLYLLISYILYLHLAC